MTGHEYKAERKRRGLSQSALAALVGVRQGTISDRETGKIEITKEAGLAILSLPVRIKSQNAPDQRPERENP